MAIDIHCHYEEGKEFLDWLRRDYADQGHKACVNGFTGAMFKKGQWNLESINRANAAM